MANQTCVRRIAGFFLASLLALAQPAWADSLCDDVQPTPQIPTNLALCAELAPIVRKPSALPLAQYETKLNDFLGNMCYRDFNSGWKMDKSVRDTGPFTATLANGKWTGTYNGTHAPVMVWYSKDMIDWLHANRPSDAAKTPATLAPIPEGAIMVKEMYSPAPASSCRVPDLLTLRPNTQGVAIMVRDSAAARDGWFWGALDWAGYAPDYPPSPKNTPSQSGFGQYCLNCHASARDNQTFASLNNIQGEPGTFLTFLSQDFFKTQSGEIRTQFSPMLQHEKIRLGGKTPETSLVANAGFLKALGVLNLPSQSFDHVWIPGAGPNAASTFITSDQCVGCHTAGGTGLQYDMTVPGPMVANPTPNGPTELMVNLSPYGTWRTSPMGLAGRDPIFYAQMASETQTFHPQAAAEVQSTCFGCHGILGQRQFSIDKAAGDSCDGFTRETVDAVPYPAGNPLAGHAIYGALARDGVSCTACHRMVLGQEATAKFQNAPQNRCVAQRQQALNPDNTGFARTFTGSFLVGADTELYGPFKDPKIKPMQHALGITPAYHTTITSSEMCGTCHTVHLPVMQNGKTIGHTYEQTTYPEWAFSAYRTGSTPDGPLPSGAGATPKSCQDCHMPKTDAAGKPFRSKIAGIQEHSNFPAVENGLPAADIDLPTRDGFARHTLVGLNIFLIDMAKQFSSVLGIATQDPMMGSYGVPPLTFTGQAILDQASKTTASITIPSVKIAGDALEATVTVVNKSGHKLPSGVGFRRAFVEFRVTDTDGKIVWQSGRTDEAGVILDGNNQPISGEMWWKTDCAGRIEGQPHQPHYQVISRQDQAQIYQELTTAPPAVGPAQCGPAAKPTGALTTSFLSICAKLKDNRLLPDGFLPLPERKAISLALGAKEDMAEDSNPIGTGDDPDYKTGGGDTIRYRIPLADIAPAKPAKVEAVFYYQATPPYFLQDRFCTAKGADRDRLAYLSNALQLKGTQAENWKLRMVASGPVPVAP